MTKLHLGCGAERIEGFINIDAIPSSATDMVQDCKRLPNFENNSVEEICSYQLIEHLGFQEFYQTIVEWWRVLKVGGKLVLECPDLEEICKLFVTLDDKARYVSFNDGPPLIMHIYGGQNTPFEFHKFGLTKSFLQNALGGIFRNFTFGEVHRDYKVPCIHMECIKK